MTSMYQMHSCNDLLENIQDAYGKLNGLSTDAYNAKTMLNWTVHNIQNAAEVLKVSATEFGDMTSHNYGQEALNSLGALSRSSTLAETAYAMVHDGDSKYNGIIVKDFSINQNTMEGEAYLNGLTKNFTDVEGMLPQLWLAFNDSNPKGILPLNKDALATARTFVPVHTAMGMWDEKHFDGSQTKVATDQPTPKPTTEGAPDTRTVWQTYNNVTHHQDPTEATCEGDVTGTPKANLTLTQCMQACDRHAPKSSPDFCVGVQFYEIHNTVIPKTLCFMLKNVKKVTEYACLHNDGCVDSPAGWYDSDGPYYDCNYYGTTQMCDEEIQYPNFGTTAREACCVCGGGTGGSGGGFIQHSHQSHSFLERKVHGAQDTKGGRGKGGLSEPQVSAVYNKCMMRFTWGHEAPVKPEVKVVNECYGGSYASNLHADSIMG